MTRREYFHQTIPLISILIFFGCLSSQTVSQPNLNFKRITVNWPTVELYYLLACDTTPDYTHGKDDVQILENSNEIKNFTIQCPSAASRCPMSVTLAFASVYDGDGMARYSEIASGLAFIDHMDGVLDQAAISWFEQSYHPLTSMTSSKKLLSDSIELILAPSNIIMNWDGLYAALLETVSNGTNPCRAVVFLTGAGDYGSARNPAELIAMANMNHVRIFTVGLGAGVDAAMLESIALQTGGKFYLTPSPGGMESIYVEISGIIQRGFDECMLSYQSSCADGTTRTVFFSTNNYCNGVDSKTKIFRAPNDSSSFTYANIRLGKVVAVGDTTALIPLELLTPLQNDLFSKANFTMLYDKSALEFVSISTPPGTLLEGVPISCASAAGGISFQITQSKIITGSGTLAQLAFKTKTSIDTIFSQLALPDWTFSSGCLTPILNDGGITIIPKTQTAIDAMPGEAQVRLGTNYPNPVRATSAGNNEETTISFELAGRMRVRLAVYDLFGRQLRELVNGELPSGTHRAVFDADGLPNGMYVYRIETPGFSKAMMLCVMK